MTKAIILIVVEPSLELEIYEKLLKLKEAFEVTPVLGTVDFIVKVKGSDHNEIATIVIKKIRALKGVTSTKTFIEDEFLKELEGLYSSS